MRLEGQPGPASWHTQKEAVMSSFSLPRSVQRNLDDKPRVFKIQSYAYASLSICKSTVNEWQVRCNLNIGYVKK